MSKERLEEINKKMKELFDLRDEDNSLWFNEMELFWSDEVPWLIEQAERVQELKEENINLKAIKAGNEGLIKMLEQQNKRYREALEFYAERDNYTTNIRDDDFNYHQAVFFDNGKKARKALESED